MYKLYYFKLLHCLWPLFYRIQLLQPVTKRLPYSILISQTDVLSSFRTYLADIYRIVVAFGLAVLPLHRTEIVNAVVTAEKGRIDVVYHPAIVRSVHIVPIPQHPCPTSILAESSRIEAFNYAAFLPYLIYQFFRKHNSFN